MKKIAYISGRLFLASIFCFVFTNLNSQDIKLTRKEQKEAKNAELAANYQTIDTLLKDRSYVIEANFLENQYGNRRPVSPILNFIKVDPSKVTLQIGNNTGLGYNGLGGITTEGRMENLRIYRNPRRLTYSIQFSVITNYATYDISMNVNADFAARATISSFTSAKLIYDGDLVPINQSTIYKGQNTF